MSVASRRAARCKMMLRYGAKGKVTVEQSRQREAAKVARQKAMSAREK